MPTIKNGNATIYYEEHGKGFPILTFAPAGLRSTTAVWNEPMAPMNPVTEWSGSYRVIVMDQRNAGGQSRAPISAKDNWDTYTSDHIAVLDHLKIDKCHLYGQCIGGSFIGNLIKKQPQRVASAVWAQAIGRVGPMKPGCTANFEGWAKSLDDHPEATDAGARRGLSQPLRPRLHLQRGPRVREELQDAVSRARGQRRSPSAPDLRRAREAAAEPDYLTSGRTARRWRREGAVKAFFAKHTPAAQSAYGGLSMPLPAACKRHRQRAIGDA